MKYTSLINQKELLDNMSAENRIKVLSQAALMSKDCKYEFQLLREMLRDLQRQEETV